MGNINNIYYAYFWNNNLSGVITCPKLTKYFIYGIGDINGFAIGNNIISNNITSINIPSEVIQIDNYAFSLADNAVFNFYPLVAPTIKGVQNPLGNGKKGILHIKPNATGYNVYPWNDKTIFKQIIRDL